MAPMWRSAWAFAEARGGRPGAARGGCRFSLAPAALSSVHCVHDPVKRKPMTTAAQTLELRFRRAARTFVQTGRAEGTPGPAVDAVSSLVEGLALAMLPGTALSYARANAQTGIVDLRAAPEDRGDRWRRASVQTPSRVLAMAWFLKELGHFPVGPLPRPTSGGCHMHLGSWRAFRVHVGVGERPRVFFGPVDLPVEVAEVRPLEPAEVAVYAHLERLEALPERDVDAALLKPALRAAERSGSVALRVQVIHRMAAVTEDLRQARRFYRQALRQLEKHDVEEGRLTSTLISLAECDLGLERVDAAKKGFLRAMRIIERVYGPDDLELWSLHYDLYRCAMAEDDAEAAQRWRDAGEALRRQYVPPASR